MNVQVIWSPTPFYYIVKAYYYVTLTLKTVKFADAEFEVWTFDIDFQFCVYIYSNLNTVSIFSSLSYRRI